MLDPIFALMLRKLESRAVLGDVERAALVGLPHVRRTHEPAAYLVREGERNRNTVSFVWHGLAYRQKLTASGARQIMSLNIAGDFLDVQHFFLSHADHNIQALTQLETIDIDREAFQAIVLRYPAIGRAMWIDALADAAICREWVVNVGRRDARTRIAHLLCEMTVRSHAAGISAADGYGLSMTQEQLGDATGLTPVHVNRTLKALAKDGTITRCGRRIGFTDWERIRRAADFNDLYLHLDQIRRP